MKYTAILTLLTMNLCACEANLQLPLASSGNSQFPRPASLPPVATPGNAPTVTIGRLTASIYFADLPTGAGQFVALCGRGHTDRFTQWYCADTVPPKVTSLLDVLQGLRLFQGNDLAPETQFSLNGVNASLVTRETTSLNPRAVIYDAASPFLALSYVRGGDLVEIAARDADGSDTQFYLLHYQLPCDATDTCTPNDRYLPSNESNWTKVDVYNGHEDLKNHVLNCDTCHRPRGYDYAANQGATSVLIMQQLLDPWTHWFRANRGSNVLLKQYCEAHGTAEAYAGIPGRRLCQAAPENSSGDPALLETRLIQAYSYAQEPNITIYDGQAINDDDPNFVGPAPTKWNTLYARSVSGAVIPPPYFEIDPFDPGRLLAATRSYKAAAASRSPMQDITDLYRADVLPYIGHHAVEEVNGVPATAAQIVMHRCATCHSGKFSNSGSRDNFVASAFPDGLTAVMKEKVRQRLTVGADSILRMPPSLLTDLTPEQVKMVLDALQ